VDRLLVDGTNVVGSRPDGWWRDRPAAFGRLVARLGRLAAGGDDVTVVFDGRAEEALGEGDHGGVAVRWARRPGRDAADDRIVEIVEQDADPASLTVVTSDRALAERARARGAVVQGAGTLLRRLDALEGPAPDDPTPGRRR
jgi:predicted RNA-binding protein with PIN domain